MRPQTCCSLIAAAAVAVAVPLRAQASFRVFGEGCVFENQKPAIAIAAAPRLGTTVVVHYAGGPNFTFSSSQRIAWPQLLVGFETRKTPIATALFPAQPAGCGGYVRPDLLVPTAPDAGGAPKFADRLAFAVPNDSTLVGLRVYVQWTTVVEQCGFAGCGSAALLTSPAAELVLGR